MAIARNVDGDEVRALRRTGWSQLKIAEHLRISASTVRYHCKGIVVKNPSEKREYRRAGMSDGEPLLPSVDLAYLIGVICGDGCIISMPRTFTVSISCDTFYPELITTYTALITKLLKRPASVYTNPEGTCTQIRLSDKHLPQMLGLPAGKKPQDYPVPEWIFGDLDYVRPFIRGLIETDGNVYHEYRNNGWCSRCIFTAKIESIMTAFLRGTSMLGYELRHVDWCCQARFTRTALVKQLALELDLTKNRVYIQKPKSVLVPETT